MRLSPLALFVFLLATLMSSPVGNAQAQTPSPAAPPPIVGNVYTVTYVEVIPTSTADALTHLRTYSQAARKEDGNLRAEVVQRLNEPHQFVVLAVWKDQAAFEAHGKSASWADMREKIAAIRNAPTDQRVHGALSVGPIEWKAARGAIFVVTHVDVIPPRKDDGVAAVKQFTEAGRKADGNLRFEVVQQGNRANHFTVVEIWKDAKAVEAYSMAPAAREFRDKLAPATGALYDERKYRLVE
jgi:quinol monooxygenase YgiN